MVYYSPLQHTPALTSASSSSLAHSSSSTPDTCFAALACPAVTSTGTSISTSTGMQAMMDSETGQWWWRGLGKQVRQQREEEKKKEEEEQQQQQLHETLVVVPFTPSSLSTLPFPPLLSSLSYLSRIPSRDDESCVPDVTGPSWWGATYDDSTDLWLSFVPQGDAPSSAAHTTAEHQQEYAPSSSLNEPQPATPIVHDNADANTQGGTDPSGLTNDDHIRRTNSMGSSSNPFNPNSFFAIGNGDNSNSGFGFPSSSSGLISPQPVLTSQQQGEPNVFSWQGAATKDAGMCGYLNPPSPFSMSPLSQRRFSLNGFVPSTPSGTNPLFIDAPIVPDLNIASSTMSETALETAPAISSGGDGGDGGGGGGDGGSSPYRNANQIGDTHGAVVGVSPHDISPRLPVADQAVLSTAPMPSTRHQRLPAITTAASATAVIPATASSDMFSSSSTSLHTTTTARGGIKRRNSLHLHTADNEHHAPATPTGTAVKHEPSTVLPTSPKVTQPPTSPKVALPPTSPKATSSEVVPSTTTKRRRVETANATKESHSSRPTMRIIKAKVPDTESTSDEDDDEDVDDDYDSIGIYDEDTDYIPGRTSSNKAPSMTRVARSTRVRIPTAKAAAALSKRTESPATVRRIGRPRKLPTKGDSDSEADHRDGDDDTEVEEDHHTVPQVDGPFSSGPPADINKLNPAAVEARNSQITHMLKDGPEASEPVEDFERRVLKRMAAAITEHIQALGAKIHREANTKSRQGDYLSRMKGCLRNAAVGLYLIDSIKPGQGQLDLDVVRAILECVPPPSTRPSSRTMDAKLSQLHTRFKLPMADRQAIDAFWTVRIQSDDRLYMRRYAKNWPGHWEKLGL